MSNLLTSLRKRCFSINQEKYNNKNSVYSASSNTGQPGQKAEAINFLVHKSESVVSKRGKQQQISYFFAPLRTSSGR